MSKALHVLNQGNALSLKMLVDRDSLSFELIRLHVRGQFESG